MSTALSAEQRPSNMLSAKAPAALVSGYPQTNAGLLLNTNYSSSSLTSVQHKENFESVFAAASAIPNCQVMSCLGERAHQCYTESLKQLSELYKNTDVVR